MQGFRVRDANLWSVRGRASAKREARQARAKEKKSARFRIGEYLGRGDRAGSGEARRTSLAFIRIRSRRAPHVGQSDASGNASAGRSHTPLSTACVEEKRRTTLEDGSLGSERGNDSERRARERVRTRSHPGSCRGSADAFPDLAGALSLAIPRARRLALAGCAEPRPERPPKHAISTKTKFKQFFFGAVAKSIRRRRRRPHRSRTHASFESLKLVGVKHHVRG